MRWVLQNILAAIGLFWLLISILEITKVLAASPPCFLPGEIQKLIEGPNYYEQLAFIGLSGQGQKVMLYTNYTTSTWTMVVDAGPVDCIIAAGTAILKLVPKFQMPGQGL